MTHYLVICDDGEIEVSHHASENAARSALISEIYESYQEYVLPDDDCDEAISNFLSENDIGLTYQIGVVEILA